MRLTKILNNPEIDHLADAIVAGIADAELVYDTTACAVRPWRDGDDEDDSIAALEVRVLPSTDAAHKAFGDCWCLDDGQVHHGGLDVLEQVERDVWRRLTGA